LLKQAAEKSKLKYPAWSKPMAESESLSPREADPVQRALDRTAARVLVGRAGPAYRTATWLKLREDHAAARDAVQTEVDLLPHFDSEKLAAFELFTTQTCVNSKAEYLRRPELGRRLNAHSRELVRTSCPTGVDLQVVIGDGLSATAVAAQAPELLARLYAAAIERGWSFGRPFLVRYCRVGIMNDIGDLLAPRAVVLLIGERPGLATAESLSAYMAFCPRTGHTDADRNLISNIHTRGVSLEDATRRILALTAQFHTLGRSGVEVKEVLNIGFTLPS
jgi:ethanolamine ammonia-lyase small subunit